MTDTGLIELSNILKQNKSLTFIKFDRNELTTNGFKALQEALLVNNTLYEITLPGYFNGYLAYFKSTIFPKQLVTRETWTRNLKL